MTLYLACTYVFGLSTLWLQHRRLDLLQSACDLQLIFANKGEGSYLSLQQTLVGQERVTNPLRTSAREANSLMAVLGFLSADLAVMVG